MLDFGFWTSLSVRKTSAADIADELGISQPTFSERIRQAQSALFEASLPDTAGE